MLQAKILQHFGPEAPIDAITKAFVRYACRLCPSSGISALYRLDLNPDQRAAIRILKDWFDYSCHRNDLFRAHWSLAQRKRPQYRTVGRKFGLDPEELRFQFRLLLLEERNELHQQPEPQRFSAAQIVKTIHNVERYSRYLVKQYLRYCYNNDGGIDREDFWADLTCQGVKIIRNYEVTGLTVEQMTPLVARGISNHVKNLAIYYGKDRRNPLQRIEHRTDTREAWYCNLKAEQVEHVWVYVAPEHRKGDYYLAEFDDRSPAYIYCHRLFDTAIEADEALSRYQEGKGRKRQTVVDLTAEQIDDWQPVMASLDTPSHDDGAPLINFLPACTNDLPYEDMLDDPVKDIRDPKVRLFCDAFRGDLGPMFDRFCLDTLGKSAAELTETSLARAAQRYSGITARELTQHAPQL